ncbi:hypothetical protein SLNWT_1232 [Streptomyces albus]|uniref:Uncharacterized protein n=1 Tax=Streptomyces albus (strain ATCC 21838 / DSM 41398 / FERM P-419 / JCM 4703 / NBRC 107858) TaxID=1081613 RepID=A0A0B5EHE4_STRA4|nr:hypothetical protein SLNWT_1232 [Streptomyces albus]AOU75923.1 hypothetical protein SLNHY_1232 [Streptomyces albus]AYN31729.1 hypothetical protein DUI70_1226 [Streptomyces albus]
MASSPGSLQEPTFRGNVVVSGSVSAVIVPLVPEHAGQVLAIY